MFDTPSHGRDHLWLIWKESIQNCRCYRADTAGRTDGRTDRRMDRRMDRRTDGVKPIYPPTTSLFGGYKNKSSQNCACWWPSLCAGASTNVVMTKAISCKYTRRNVNEDLHEEEFSHLTRESQHTLEQRDGQSCKSLWKSLLNKPQIGLNYNINICLRKQRSVVHLVLQDFLIS